MSTRDKLFTMLDQLSDEQLEGLYAFLKNLIPISEEPNEKMLTAMREVEDMRQHPEQYKSYGSIEALIADLEGDDEI